MKIGFLIVNLSAGGAERATCALANFMAEAGHEVHIITIENTPAFYYLSEKVKRTVVESPDIAGLNKIKRALGAVKKMFVIRRTVKALRLDALLGMSSFMSMYALFSAVFTKTKAISNERSNPFTYLAGGMQNLLKKLTFTLSDGAVLQTQRAASFFPSSAQKKAAVIPNAVFNPVVFETPRCENKTKTVCAMGRLIECKGFDVLMRAFAEFSKEHPDYELKIFGDGALREELEIFASSLGAGDKIRLMGNDINAIKQVAQGEIFVLSSRMEGMPNALMEAMACGVACVSTDCDMGPAELIEDGVNGLLVPVDDAEAMANAMSRYADDEKFRHSVEDEAYKMRTTHSIEDIGKRWLDYLEKVCKK